MATHFVATVSNPTSFVTLAFRNRIEYRNADGRVNSIWYKYGEIPSSNSRVYEARMRTAGISQINTRVSFTTFVRGRHR